jgi:hypothetical protein
MQRIGPKSVRPKQAKKELGNTVGSRSKTNLAYIAGFLDGDGSLMLQIKKRKDGNKSRSRFMATICFYQDTRHEKPLFWIRDVFGIGYISRRKDRITELRINGYKQVERILKVLIPFIQFKKVQAKILFRSVKLLQKKHLMNSDLRKLVNNVLKIQKENYVAKRKKSKRELIKVLDLTP